MISFHVIRPSRIRFGTLRIVLLCSLFTMACAGADEAVGTNQVHVSSASASNEVAGTYFSKAGAHTARIIDTVQGSTSTRLVSIAQWVDSFFIDPDYVEEQADAHVTLQQSVKFYRYFEPELRTSVRASVVLPNINRRLRLVLEGNDERDLENPTQPFDETLLDSTEQSVDNPAVSLQYFFLQNPDIDLSLSGGVRLSEPSLYVAPRIALRAGLGAGWESKLTERIYWYTTGNVRSDSEFRFDHLLGKRNLFRQTFQMYWERETYDEEGFLYNLNSSITHPLIKKDAAFRYAWATAYQTRPAGHWTSTTLSMGYRQSIWRKWLIMEITPFVTWEEQYQWEPSPGIFFSISAIFQKD